MAEIIQLRKCIGLDTGFGGLLNYVSCVVGESTKCFGNGADERNAKSTDGYQSFRFLVLDGWELDWNWIYEI